MWSADHEVVTMSRNIVTGRMQGKTHRTKKRKLNLFLKKDTEDC